MHDKKYTWYKIAESIAELHFNNNNLLELEVGGKNVCVARTSKGIAACAAKCPHACGIMADGFIDKNDNIICPVHRYVFSLEHGRDKHGEGYYLKIYPLRQDDSGIFIGIEESGFLSWLK